MNDKRGRRPAVVAAAGLFALIAAAAAPLSAQTDYYNTDRNRPVRIEDAHPTERYAFELKLAPVRLERGSDGAYSWSVDPEIAYGILPGTSLELGFPLSLSDAGDSLRGLEGVEVSAFHNLNTETLTFPALALRGDLTLPVGALGPDRVRPSLTGIATRTFSHARVHLNARYTFGRAPGPEDFDERGGHEDSRWLAGIAVDRAYPLQALLLIADVHVMQPLHAADDPEWSAGAGLRYQVNPYLAIDSGLGRRLTADPTWFVTLGAALHLGVRRLIPLAR